MNILTGYPAFLKAIVQLGPSLKSETKALDQSRTLNSLWTTHHPPPTHHHRKLFEGFQASYKAKIWYVGFI